jgi:hypothetical protein
MPLASSAINAGCGRFNTKTASYSPLVLTSTRLLYQALRGLTLSFSAALPAKRSQVHFTSAAVNGLPSCHLTSLRRWKVRRVPSSSQAQSVASSGRIAARLFTGTCWSNSTRLLNTAMTGRSANTVASSWIDMLAGLSMVCSRRMPPCFWACAAPIAASRTRAMPAICRYVFMLPPLFRRNAGFPSGRFSRTIDHRRRPVIAAEPAGARLRCALDR